jgi:hypothetical protein
VAKGFALSPTLATDECGVGAFGVVQATLAAMPALRKKPGPDLGAPVPASLLKHADEQSVAGLAAVAHAIHDSGRPAPSFADWGVLGAPRYPGRLRAGEAIGRFLDEGPVGVSPHVIPHQSTHALSGTISLALRMRGPNHGVGGAPGAVIEGLLAALALATEGRLPGVWLVLTEWGPEPVPDGSGPRPEEAICHAAALALVPTAEEAGLSLRLIPPPFGASADGAAAATVASLIAFLREGDGSRSWLCPLERGGALELSGRGAGGGEHWTSVGAQP